MMFNLIVSVQ